MGSETQKVVIIDDEPTTLLLLESVVESLEKVVTVSQSVQAFESVKLHRNSAYEPRDRPPSKRPTPLSCREPELIV